VLAATGEALPGLASPCESAVEEVEFCCPMVAMDRLVSFALEGKVDRMGDLVFVVVTSADAEQFVRFSLSVLK
jgi:hypothetical protein